MQIFFASGEIGEPVNRQADKIISFRSVLVKNGETNTFSVRENYPCETIVNRFNFETLTGFQVIERKPLAFVQLGAELHHRNAMTGNDDFVTATRFDPPASELGSFDEFRIADESSSIRDLQNFILSQRHVFAVKFAVVKVRRADHPVEDGQAIHEQTVLNIGLPQHQPFFDFGLAHPAVGIGFV